MEFQVPENAESVLEKDSYLYLSVIYGALARYCVGVLEDRRTTRATKDKIEKLNGYLRRLPAEQGLAAQACDDHAMLTIAERIDHEAYRQADELALKVNPW